LTRLRHFPDSRGVNKTHFILYELFAQLNTLVLLVSLNRLYCVHMFLSKVASDLSFMARDLPPGSTWMRLGVTQVYVYVTSRPQARPLPAMVTLDNRMPS